MRQENEDVQQKSKPDFASAYQNIHQIAELQNITEQTTFIALIDC